MNTKFAKQDLVNAKAKHYFFKAKMRAYLEGSTEVSEEILVDHNACGLGKWINEIGKNRYGKYPELEELDIIHQNIHAVAKDIIISKKNGNMEAAEKHMFKVNEIGIKLIKKIEELEIRLGD